MATDPEHFDPLELLTLEEAGQLLRRSRRSLYRDIDAGRIHAVKLGGSTRIARFELEKFIEDALGDE
jgi:excisionase family DNA binding protein